MTLLAKIHVSKYIKKPKDHNGTENKLVYHTGKGGSVGIRLDLLSDD